MLKRSALYLPKILKLFQDDKLGKMTSNIIQGYSGALIGLADIQEYYDFHPKDISNGIFKWKSDVL